MSRVSDAMRRAGHEDDGSAAVPDDTAFVSGEDGLEASEDDAIDAAQYEPPPPDEALSEAPRSAIRGELVPHGAPLPSVPARFDRGRGDSDEDIRLQDVLRLLWRRKWLMAGVLAGCVSVAVTYARTVTPIYEATARVVVEPTAQQVVPFRGNGDDPSRFEYFTTQIEVLRSRQLSRKTLERLNQLPVPPGGDSEPLSTVLGSLNVTPSTTEIGDSRVLNIKVQSTSPERAAQVANVHAQMYVDTNLEKLREGSREAAEWLNERLTKLAREVNSSQGDLQTYREQQDAVSLEERQNIVVEKLARLNADVTVAQTELLTKRTVYQQLEELEKRGAALDTLQAVQSNQSLQPIRSELEGLKQNRTKLSQTYLPSAPEMKEIDTAIENQERRLAAETSKIAMGIKTDYQAAQTREQGLIAALEAQKDEVLALNKKSIGYSALQRNATSIQQIFDMVMTRLKETELTGSLPSNNIRILDTADAPGTAIWPRTTLIVSLALLGGSFLAVGLVFALEFLRPRLLDPEDVATSLGLPLLGTAPKVGKFVGSPTNPDAVPSSFQEAIRHIRAQIFLSAASSSVRTIAVTSTHQGEGKTVMSTNLAISIAMSGRRVLLVDGDLRRSELARLFSIPRAPGLSNIVAGEVKPSEALVESPIKGLYVLPAGDERTNPGDLLDSERLSQLMSGLRKVFDVIVFDCPPVMAVADAAIVASAASSVVFVVGAGLTSRAEAQRAVERLEAVQARILGVVLNKAKPSQGVDYYALYYPRNKSVGNA